MNLVFPRVGLAILLLAVSMGCSPSVRRPQLHNPGPAAYQRYNAVHQTDPYPLPDMGPEMVGVRPREFQRPVPAVERARQFSQQQHMPQFVAPAPASPY